MEAKFGDITFARDVYTSVVRRVVDAGVSAICHAFDRIPTHTSRPRHAVTTDRFT